MSEIIQARVQALLPSDSSIRRAFENKRRAIKYTYKRSDIQIYITLPSVLINIVLDYLFSKCLKCNIESLRFELTSEDSKVFEQLKEDPYCMSCEHCKETCKGNTRLISHLEACTRCHQWVCRRKLRYCQGDKHGPLKKDICCTEKCSACDPFPYWKSGIKELDF